MKSANCVRLLLLAAFLALPSLLGAQEMRMVTGSVTDASNMRTLPGVQVTIGIDFELIQAIDRQVTDSEGTFHFEGIPSGDYYLGAYQLGTRGEVVREVSVAAGETLYAELEFPEDTATIEGIITRTDEAAHSGQVKVKIEHADGERYA